MTERRRISGSRALKPTGTININQIVEIMSLGEPHIELTKVYAKTVSRKILVNAFCEIAWDSVTTSSTISLRPELTTINFNNSGNFDVHSGIWGLGTRSCTKGMSHAFVLS
jgi:hypothetical protein